MGRAETRFALGLLGFKLCAQLPAWKKKELLPLVSPSG